MTPFEQAQEQVKNKVLQTPSISTSGKKVDYFGYQLAVHHFNLKLMARNMKFSSITFTQIKKYYGLKGRGAADCLPQFEKIMEDYKKQFIIEQLPKN